MTHDPDRGASRSVDAPPPEDRAHPPDQDVRARILTDLETNLLVEAGAGSGKTTELVNRMLGLIRSGRAPVERIAAVTFTRKAAAELQERLRGALEAARDETAPDSPERTRLDTALADLDRAFVGTIHAFCARLLRERPIEAGVEPGFRELREDEAEALAREFWYEWLDRLTADGDSRLAALTGMGIQPSHLFPLFEQLLEDPDVEHPLRRVPAPSAEEIARVRAKLEHFLDEAVTVLPGEEPERGWDGLQRTVRTLLWLRSRPSWERDGDFLDLVTDLHARSDRSVEFKPTYWAPRSETGDAKALHARFQAEYRSADSETGRLVDTWLVHRYPIAMEFALDAAAEYARRRRRTGRLTFADLLLLTRDLLRTSPEARTELGARHRWILVDEFQDTDPLQAEILFLLGSEPDRSREDDGAGPWLDLVPRPGALFVVGDPKQSIYRFRRADISLYAAIRRRFAEFGAVLTLEANFRSVDEIGALVNTVFGRGGAFPAEGDDRQAPFAPFRPQRPPVEDRPSGVFVYRIEPEKRTHGRIEAADREWLADWIEARVGPGGDRRPEDFLVLTWNSTPLDRYAQALEARRIPVEVTGAGLVAVDEVEELLTLLRALADPADPVATLAALVGLFFGLDYERLLQHAEKDGRFDLRDAAPDLGTAPDPSGAPASTGEGAAAVRGHPEVIDALSRLHGWWALAAGRSADTFVEQLVEELGLIPLAASEELGELRAGTVRHLLERIREACARGRTSLRDALEATEVALRDDRAEAPLRPGRPDAVRLMNLHKAKGLEAPVVVLAHPLPPKRHEPDRRVRRTTDGRVLGWRLVSAGRPDGRGARLVARPPEWREHAREEEAFADAERTRLLYVAATRARDELVIACDPNPKPEGGSPWAPLERGADEIATELGAPPPSPPQPTEPRTDPPGSRIEAALAETRAARERATVESYRFESATGLAKELTGARAAEGSLFAPPSARRGDSHDGKDSSGPSGLEWGRVVHATLEAAAHGLSDGALVAFARSALLTADRRTDPSGEPVELSTLLDMVERVRRHELWRRADEAELRLAEVPFVAPFDPVPADEGEDDPGVDRPHRHPPERYIEGVIDLAFRERDGWVLIDYKTDRPTEAGAHHGGAPHERKLAIAPFRLEEYERQIRIYADAWQHLTGEAVKEKILLFVSHGAGGLIHEVL